MEAMEVNRDDEVNQVTVKNLADQVEESLAVVRKGGEPDDGDVRQRLLTTGALALKELTELLPETPIRTRAHILAKLVQLAVIESKTIVEQHTHLHQEEHQHIHWDGSLLQAAAKTAEEQDRLRKRAVEW